jgi:thiol-disulfide isomerase/thioredoxin
MLLIIRRLALLNALLLLLTAFSPSAHAKLKEGDEFPALKVVDFPGAPKWKPELLKGKVVIVDFWASWCEPCKVELPALNKLYKKYKSKGLMVVGINVDDDAKEAKAFLKDHPVSFPLAHDKGQKNAGEMGIEKMPTSFILSGGKVVRLHEAFREGDEKKIEGEIKKLLK